MLFSNKTSFRYFAFAFAFAWLLPVVVAIGSLLLQVSGCTAIMRYASLAVQQGEFWRLFTGNYVHLGWTHYVLNMLGLGLIWYLFGHKVPWAKWLLAMSFISVGIGVGLYCFSPTLEWYVGLSGVLHGMFVVGLLLESMSGYVFKAVFLMALALKLFWEQWVGSVPGSSGVIGGMVVVDAHLYGAIAGVVVVLLFGLYGRIISPSGSCSG